MYNGTQEYQHETGWLGSGTTRDGLVWAETGSFEIDQGDKVMHVDRIWQDDGATVLEGVSSTPGSFTVTFKLRQAPSAPERIVGPITLNTTKGYTTTRFRTRQVAMRINQVKDVPWSVGKLRLRLKPGGMR
jgi:hypothetical protein